MEQCKSYESEPKNYHLYVHGYFIPWLEKKRVAGQLKNCKQSQKAHILLVVATTEVKVIGDLCQYQGEIDENGEPCGVGEATKPGFKFTGLWLEGARHGICKFSDFF